MGGMLLIPSVRGDPQARKAPERWSVCSPHPILEVRSATEPAQVSQSTLRGENRALPSSWLLLESDNFKRICRWDCLGLWGAWTYSEETLWVSLGPWPRVPTRPCAHLPRTPLKHHPLSGTQMAPPQTPCKLWLRRAGAPPASAKQEAGSVLSPSHSGGGVGGFGSRLFPTA